MNPEILASCASFVFAANLPELPRISGGEDNIAAPHLPTEMIVGHQPESEFGPPLRAPEIPARGSSYLDPIRDAAKSVVTVNLDGSLGSGFILKHQGRYYVVTNAHVVNKSHPEGIDVTLPGGRIVLVEKVRSDPLADIAVLWLKGNGPYTDTAATLGDSDKIGVGDMVAAIGSPLGLAQTISFGHITGEKRDFAIRGLETVSALRQTDAPINNGNSGGPLFNEKGEVVAIVSNRLEGDSLGFGIPINEAMPVITQLIKNGVPVHGYLGAHIVTPTRAVLLNVTKPGKDGAEPLVPSWAGAARRLVGENSALVIKVEPNSPAAMAEIKPGDVIIGINGERIVGDGDLRSRIAATPSGQEVELQIVRKAPESEKFLSITLTIQLGSRLIPQGTPFLATLPPLPHLSR